VARTRSVVTLVSLLLVLGIAAAPIQTAASAHGKDSRSKHSHSKDTHGKGSKRGKDGKGSHSKHATHRTKTVLLRKAVRRSGIYSVHVTIAWPATPRGAVKL